MLLSRLPAILVLTATFLGSGTLMAVDAPILNTHCPVSGTAIDPAKAPTVLMTIGEGTEARQFRIAMCSDACCAEMKSDPAKSLKPLFDKTGKNAPGPKTMFK